MSNWTPDSWRALPVEQAVEYPDAAELASAVARLHALPPLVTSWEVERLREHLAAVAEGRSFLLQGGDCAEALSECTSSIIANKLKILLQMSLVLMHGLRRPILRVGRIAGQYAKPRSSATETQNGVTLPSYFGDLINGYEFDAAARRPDPNRLVTCFQHAAMTLNFVRGLIDGGFADLHHPEYWDLNFLGKAGLPEELKVEFKRRADDLGNAIRVMEVIAGEKIERLSTVEFYTSHEALSLPYESALTRTVPRREGYYNLGAHMIWIGERTRSLTGAHVEYIRGVRNPVGIKLGPSVTPEVLKSLADKVDPCREAGRLVLIGRFGANRCAEVLPPLIEAMKQEGRRPVWICDPMHANTISTKSGIKTRQVDAILKEVLASIDAHEAAGGGLGGVHFELTAEAVTECVGGASGVTEEDLPQAYQSRCDPRLNYEQAMEMAFAIARRMQR